MGDVSGVSETSGTFFKSKAAPDRERDRKRVDAGADTLNSTFFSPFSGETVHLSGLLSVEFKGFNSFIE